MKQKEQDRESEKRNKRGEAEVRRESGEKI